MNNLVLVIRAACKGLAEVANHFIENEVRVDYYKGILYTTQTILKTIKEYENITR